MRTVDPLGLVSTASYDQTTGNLIVSTADVGASPHFNLVSSFTYNGFGQVRSATDPLGVVTQYGYDGFGNQVSIIRDVGSSGHLNQTSTVAYNAVGDPVSATDPNGNVTTSTFDVARRLASTQLPPPSRLLTTSSYDPDGRPTKVQQSANGVTLRSTAAAYTVNGKLASTTDANGNTTTMAYDRLDRVASVTDPTGRVTVYGYDALSRRIAVSNPAIQGSPLLQQAYTPDGLLASLTDANNHALVFAYDGLDRLGTTTYPNASTEVLTYDTDGNVKTRRTRAGQTITFAYDTLNRLSSKTPPSPAAVVSYQYDRAGRVTSVSDTSASITPPASGPVAAMTYSYDGVNRLTATSFSPVQAQAPPSAGTAASFAFAYNASNQRISQTTTDNSFWTYPAATPSTVSYTANNLNQYIAVGAVTPSYDGNGNLTYDGNFTYCYDTENRLVAAINGGTCALPATTVAAYSYDAQGRRKSKTVSGTTTITVTDPFNRALLDYDGSSGAVLHWYAFSLGSNDVLNQTNVALGSRTTFIPDIQGSIVATLDSTTGAIAKTGYLPYGASSGSPVTFGYTAQRIDPETNGLYYYRARNYSPLLGRFMQPDPIGTQGGANLYAYVNNDPVNAVDSMGLWSPAAHDAILQYAFGGRLSPADIQVLQRSSRVFDSNTQGFGSDTAPLHSMRAIGQTDAAAIAARDAFINQTTLQAQQLNQNGNPTGALIVLGQALHPIMDASSPEHTTPEGLPRLWAPWNAIGHSPADCGTFCGNEQASDLTPAILDQQRGALNEAYNRVFGYANQMSSGSARAGASGK